MPGHQHGSVLRAAELGEWELSLPPFRFSPALNTLGSTHMGEGEEAAWKAVAKMPVSYEDTFTKQPVHLTRVLITHLKQPRSLSVPSLPHPLSALLCWRAFPPQDGLPHLVMCVAWFCQLDTNLNISVKRGSYWEKSSIKLAGRQVWGIFFISD